MSWILEGKKVSGTYLEKFPVTGTVTQSRVAYGGRVHHYIDLDTPIQVFGRIAETVILDRDEITHVYSSLNELI